MWFRKCCPMDMAALISLIGVGIKSSFIRSTHLDKVPTLDSCSGLDLDLTQAGIHERKSTELNLELSLGNEAYKSSKVPKVSRPTPVRFGSNPLYFSEAGPSRPEYQSLGPNKEKYNMISGTVSTKRSFDELNLQPNFFLHTPLNPINPENISNKKITLGDSQHIYLSQPQFFWGQPVRINDHSSDSIEKNHRIIYNNFPHKRKYMADNFPMEIGAQSQNFQHNPGLDVFEVSKSSHETSFGENSITKNLDPQNSRISAGSSKPTKNQNVSNRVVIKSRGDYKIINRTFRTTKEIESAKTDIWKEVKVKEYKGLPLFDWEFIVTNKNPNTNCLAEPYSNVFYLSNDNLDLLRSSINTDIYYYKENADIMFSSKKRPAVLVALYKKHEDFFSSWKTDDSKKYFEALGKSWEADYDGRENKFQARVRCVKFATAYAIERIGFMTENNEFKIFADIEKAKEDAYEILKSYWKTLPLGKHFTGTWQLEKNEKPTNIPLLDHLRLPDLNGVTRASYGAETLCFALKHILPDNYHQSILTAKTNKNTLPKGLIQKLNNIALSVDHLKTKEKNLKLD